MFKGSQLEWRNVWESRSCWVLGAREGMVGWNEDLSSWRGGLLGAGDFGWLMLGWKEDEQGAGGWRRRLGAAAAGEGEDDGAGAEAAGDLRRPTATYGGGQLERRVAGCSRLRAADGEMHGG